MNISLLPVTVCRLRSRSPEAVDEAVSLDINASMR